MIKAKSNKAEKKKKQQNKAHKKLKKMTLSYEDYASKSRIKFQKKLERDEKRLAESIRDRWFIISIGNVYKFYWDIVVICLAIYNAVALPLQIAFVGEVK